MVGFHFHVPSSWVSISLNMVGGIKKPAESPPTAVSETLQMVDISAIP